MWFSQKKSGLPYGLLLTSVFDFFRVDKSETDNIDVSDCIHVNNLTQSNLKLLEDGNLVHLLPKSATVSSPQEIINESSQLLRC